MSGLSAGSQPFLPRYPWMDEPAACQILFCEA